MKYYSLNNTDVKVSFKQAAITGIAPDKGLYFPESIPQHSEEFINNLSVLTNEEIAFKVIKPFIGDDIPDDVLQAIIAETLSFSFPLSEVEKDIYALELFHGPTLAFKDVGARFMSRCLNYFTDGDGKKITILVATSGDTGGAVANGFLGAENINVVLLYPSGKVSTVQEKQLTTLGDNIAALEVNGSFDDCQDMVKQAFLDSDITEVKLTSANSINVARWLPQMFYYFFAYKQLTNKTQPLAISVPSGNFGNICAGLMAKKTGLPIARFIAATNSNDTVPRYMHTQQYSPFPTRETLSNAMDVSNPSNFVRILQLFNKDFNGLTDIFSSYSFSDKETLATIREVYNNHNYLCDPHGAVGYLGLKNFMNKNDGYTGIFLETAHPVKFADSITDKLQIEVPVPKKIEAILKKQKKSITINSYDELKDFLKNSG